MKAILEEYGMILVSIAITLIFILFASPFGQTIVDYTEDSLAKFYAEAMKHEDFPKEESLNEYGFYYGKEYIWTETDIYSETESLTITWSIKFNKDGSGVNNSRYDEQYTSTEVGKIVIPNHYSGTRKINFTDNGTHFTGEGDFYINNTGLELNEHGFYYGTYIATDNEKGDGAVCKYTFNKDGTCVYEIETNRPSGYFTYEVNKISSTDFGEMPVSNNGTKITLIDNYEFNLKNN